MLCFHHEFQSGYLHQGMNAHSVMTLIKILTFASWTMGYFVFNKEENFNFLLSDAINNTCKQSINEQKIFNLFME